MSNTADVTSAYRRLIAAYLSSVLMLLILSSPFTTSIEEKERCYSFILSRTPHETHLKMSIKHI
jgi:hypothetical protein